MSRKQQLHRPGPQPGPPADDTGCHILHVDMDAFFVSVELLERPELRGRPVIVGGAGPRGVVSAASYEARTFGVHSAMPMTRARRLCPQAVVLPVSHGKYSRVSAAVFEIFRSITPLVEACRWTRRSWTWRAPGAPATAEIARLIREQVRDQQGITCSVGVASTKFIAKLASTRCKPDGLLVVPADGAVGFLHPLPVASLWGVGERTEQNLTRLGLRTVGQLAQVPLATLQRELGTRWARTCTSWRGAATRARSSRTRPTRASAPRRRSTPTSTIPRSSAGRCCGWRRRPASGCARAGTPDGRSASNSGWRASRRSPGRAH